MQDKKTHKKLAAENGELQARLQEAEETLLAIRNHGVDANEQLPVEIDERRRTDEAVFESEERFRSMFEHHKAVMLLIDPESGAIVEANAAASEFYGYSREQLTAMKIQNINQLPPERVAAERQKAAGEQISHFTFQHCLADGHLRWVDVYSTPFEAKGRTLLFSVIHDITDRRRAEEALTRSVERFGIISSIASELLFSSEPQKIVEALCRKVMEHLDCQVFFNFLVDNDRNCLRLNAYAGIPEETAREIHFLDYGIAVCGCAARDACRVVAENIPTTPDVRTDLVRSFGITAYACHPLFSRGRAIGTLSFGTRSRLTFTEDELSVMKTVADQVAIAMERVNLLQSERDRGNELERRVEERTAELTQTYKKLEREVADRAKVEDQLRQSQKMEAIGTLAGGIAHDFNNILAAIIGFSEMIQEDLPQGDPSIPHVQRVLNAAHRGRDLVQQILAFSRKTRQSRHAVSLSSLAKETVVLLRASLPTTIELVLDITTTSDAILATHLEVQQVLMNLATNAAFSMRENKGLLHISITDIDIEPNSPILEGNMVPGEYVRLAVTDTGIGMTPEVMKRIFEPFFTTGGADQSTGMGLAVVYGIVKSLHGGIMVESEPGVGSTFQIFFPKVLIDTDTGTPQCEQNPRGTERILFIDDEESLVEWGETFLKRLGYDVIAMNDSAEALHIFASDPSRFDLVITDQTMPGITGSHLARELLKIRPDIPIILCTGHSDVVSPEEAKQAGIKEFLMKPVAGQALAKVIRNVLYKKHGK